MDREKFLSNIKPELKPIEVDWLDEPVFVRRVPASVVVSGFDGVTDRLQIVTMCMCDADGKLILEPGDTAALEAMDLDKLRPILNAAIEFNNWGADVEELAGN